MLVLTRKKSQQIHVGKDVVITIVEITPGRVRVGVEAPQDMVIARAEINAGFVRKPPSKPHEECV